MKTTVTPPGFRSAGIVTRLLAATIDMVIVLLMLGGVFFGVAAAGFLISPLSFWWPTPPSTLTILVGLLLAVGYLTVGWATLGRTCGAAVLGLRVLSTARGRLGGARAFLRALLYVIFPVGLLWSAVSRERRSVQDLVMRSVVVYDAPPTTLTVSPGRRLGVDRNRAFHPMRVAPPPDSGGSLHVHRR